MADQQEIDATIDRLHAAGATDDEVTSLIKEKYGKPFDVNAQNATMRANMVKQPAGTGEEGALASFAHSGAMADMGEGLDAAGRGEGAKAAHHLVIGASKVAAPAALPAIAAAPVAAGGAILGSVAGSMLAHKAASAVTDNPDYQDVAGDVGGLVGGAGGGRLASKLPVEPVLRFASDAITKAPGSGAIMRLIGHGANAGLDAADEVAARARGPVSQLFAPGPVDPKVIAADRAAGMADADTIVKKTIDDQHAEAIRTNARLMDEAKRRAAAAPKAPKPPTPSELAAQERARLGVVSTADAVASNPGIATQSTREAVPAPLGRTAGEVTDAENADNPLLAELRKRYPTPQEPDVNIAESGELPGRVNTPTHPQTGQGGRGHEATPAPTPVTTNGSGTAGGGSLEEVNRAAANKAAGTRFALHGPGGLTEIADQAGAQDIQPGRGRALVRITKDGEMTVETAGKGYTGVGVGKKATTLQEIATRVKDAPDAATARKLAEGIIERERSRRLSASDKSDMVARVMDIIAERRRGGGQ